MSISAAGRWNLTRVPSRSHPSLPVVRKVTSTSSARKPSDQQTHVKLEKGATTETAATEAAGNPGPGRELADCKSIEGVRFDKLQNSWTTRWVTQDGVTHKRGFSAAKYGFFEAKQLAEKLRAEALAAGARSHRTRAERGKPKHAEYQSGYPGVTWHGQNRRWMVKWVDADTGAWVRTSFRADLHGFETAKQMAIAARQEAEQSGKVRVSGQQSKLLPSAKYHSHVPGVTYDGTPGSERWLARWYQPNGERVRMSFSVRRHGMEEAQRLAEQARTAPEQPGKTS